MWDRYSSPAHTAARLFTWIKSALSFIGSWRLPWTKSKAGGALARWMAGNQTVKDLDKKAQVTGEAFEYFPVWYFKRRSPDGKEEILLEPAAATSVSELRTLKLPAGDLRKYDTSVDPQARPPSVPLETARGWTLERQPSSEIIAEQALVHIPLYTFKYNYQGKPFTAVVEAGTGGVFRQHLPGQSRSAVFISRRGYCPGLFMPGLDSGDRRGCR